MDVTAPTTALAPPPPARTPRGYVPTFALSGFGIYVAVLAPLYGGLSVKVQDLVGLDQAPQLLGLLTGSGALFSLVVQPLAGRLSDRSMSRFGIRRPFILGGVLGMVLSLVVCGLAPNFPLLLVAWCAGQLFINLALAAQHATLADQVPEEKRGGVSGIVGAATPAAILGGSLFLAIAPNDFLRFALPALFALVVTIMFVLVLKDPVRKERPTTTLGLRTLLTSFVFSPKKNPDFAWAWLSKLLILLGYGSVATYLTLFLGSSYGMTTDEQLSFNAKAQIFGVGTLIVFSLAGGFISDRVGRRRPFVVASGLAIAVGVVLVGISPVFGQSGGLTMIIVAQVVMGMGAGTFFAVDQALCISLLPDPEEMAKDLGILNLAQVLASAVSPVLAGLVFIPLGGLLFGAGYVTWFMVAAGIAVLGSAAVLKVNAR
ncbi:MFS transporter [Geodermatophilaceae bacterium NBWT11]|nr:MFS transporter [Geodermatophilaceae bacterium NBWT11]